MHVYVEHAFKNASVDALLEVYFDPAFNAAVAPHAKLKSREIVETESLADGRVRRRIRMVPNVKLPRVLRALTKDAALSYDEVSVFDPSTQVARYHVESAAQARLQVEGEIRFFARGADAVRVIDGTLTVRVPGLAGVIEALIQRELDARYATIAAFTQAELDARAQSSR